MQYFSFLKLIDENMSKFTCISPIDGEVVFSADYDGAGEIEACLVSAKRAQSAWRDVPLADRLSRLQAAIDYLYEKRDEIGAEITLQMGRPVRYSAGELVGVKERGEMMLSLAAKAFNNTRYVAAQTMTDAKRMIQLGCEPERIFVIGSLKFDIIIEDQILKKGEDIRSHYPENRLIWIAASTHLEDEIEILDAYAVLKQRHPDLMLVIVPRHPERFQSTTQACRNKGFQTQLRSEDGLSDIDTDVFVVDTMGELLEFYASSDIAFVGGSLADIGGHNVLEAAVFSLPVLVGPNTHNFEEITQLLNDCGGSFLVHDANDIIRSMDSLIADKVVRVRMGQSAYNLVKEHKGTVQMTMMMIDTIMNQKALPVTIQQKNYPEKLKKNEVNPE